MKIKYLALVLLIVMCFTMLCSCELLKFVNHMLNIFGPDDDNSINNDIDINIQLPGTGSGSHTHSWATIPGKPATCIEAGYSDKVVCSECGEVYVDSHELPILAHSYDDSLDVTCNVCGYVRSCTHSLGTDPIGGYDATCTIPGLTEGEKCSKCGEVVVAQTVIPAKGHTEGEKKISVQPTESTDGKYVIPCATCGVTMSEGNVPATGSIELVYTWIEEASAYEATALKADTIAIKIVYVPDEYNGYPVIAINLNGVCRDTETVYLGANVERVEGNAFCKSFAVSENNTYLAADEDGVLYSKDGKTLYMVPRYYDAYDDASCTFVVPEGVETISTFAFGSLYTMKKLVLPDSLLFSERFFLGSDVERNEYGGCLYIGTKTNPYHLLYDVKDTSMQKCVLHPNTKVIGPFAFEKCTQLAEITLNDSLISINASAFNGTSLNAIVIPLSVKYIQEYTFWFCTNNKNDFKILCEAEVAPEGWENAWWGMYGANVSMGYKGE